MRYIENLKDFSDADHLRDLFDGSCIHKETIRDIWDGSSSLGYEPEEKIVKKVIKKDSVQGDLLQEAENS